MKLRIEKAVYGGDGLARIPADEPTSGGKTVFVPGTLPGELVEASITTERRSFSTAGLTTILEPSPERVVPGCAYVPRCGGCQYQHAGAAFQLQMKLSILKETLARAHVPVPAEIDLLSVVRTARPGAVSVAADLRVVLQRNGFTAISDVGGRPD